MKDHATELSAALGVVRRRWRTLIALHAGSRIGVFAAVLIAGAAVFERWRSPSDAALLGLAALTAAAVGAACLALGWPLRRRPDDGRIARLVEERFPQLEDTVVTAAAISARGSAEPFARLVLESAAARLRTLDLSQVIERRDLRHAAWRAAGAAVALVLALVIGRGFALRAVQAAYLRAFPALVTISVRPGDLRVPAGRPITIAASLSGRHVSLDRLLPLVTLDAGGRPTTLPMERAADGYRLRVSAVDRSFTYRVTAGPAASTLYAVTALHAPRVQRIELHYDYPAFAGLKPRDERDGGDVYGPAGTRVRLTIHTDKPVASGRLAFTDGKAGLPLDVAGDRALQSTMTVREEAAYRVALADTDGITSEGVEYFVRVMDDRPPDVHILRPSGDQQITPLDEVPIEARADDDYGIASFDMVYSVGGGPEKVVPFTRLGGTELARIGTRLLAAEDLHVKPGDVIAYYARATDVPRGKRSTMSRSEIFFLEVTPFNEEYTLAQSQAMAAATGNQIEGLIAAQKEIISATWNLERRSAAGRSTTDVRNVADAQAELKVRAERAAGAERQRRRSGQEPFQQAAPPRSQAASGDDPVRAAIDAMARALEQLQTLKTAEAIPHEMAALNALLQAQAEVRRRQLTQQQSAGGSYGGGRSGQDLSTLFDRELKRQQKTVYENKSQIESAQDEQKSGALDKIRDLARRQEELSRQQRDLATSSLSEEEKRRQLERLTREQEQLRRQLEAAAKEMGAQGSSRRSAEGAKADAQGAQGAVKDALDRMRDAAAELQRDDAVGAADKADEAARQLRKLESEMRSGAPDAQRRALGDLQLEAQQIAGEQRRIANEADRLDREGGGTTDARRRLAGEKDRLADRVDAMQQSARRQAAARDTAKNAGAIKSALSDAVRALDSQKLSDRMREGARALRDQKGARVGPAEQQLADALDRVTRTLNGADAGGAKGDTSRLADQLDQVRQAREKLAALDKQIRDAEQHARTRESAKGGRSGPEGRLGQRGSQGDGQGGSDIARLGQQYDEELQRTRDLMDRLQRASPETGGWMTTPERHEWSRSAPGTEAFKQDYAAWQSLASDVIRGLERYESSVAGRLADALARDRLRAGGSDRVPDAYQKRVSKYFESIASRKR